MNYILQLQETITKLDSQSAKTEQAIIDFNAFLMTDKFTGVDLDGSRKDWISTDDVQRQLQHLLNTLRGDL